MLKTKCLGIKFDNPIVLASGILGLTAASMSNTIKNGCGGVTVKSLSKELRTGHPNPTMYGREHYFMNAVGLSNAGIDEGIEELTKFKKLSRAPLIGSIFAPTADEFAELSERISEAPVDLIELNLSCPNVGKEFEEPFAYSHSAVETITKKCKAKTKIPIAIKLSPNAYNIADLAKTAEAAGADAITAVNTLSGIGIDVRARHPILHNVHGGVSGPALFPVALKCVYDIYSAVKIPIIGTGGITTGEDALAMIMAGATLLGVGSAVYYRGDDVFRKITDEMEAIMKEEGIRNLKQVRGCVHSD
jgi:dihydroorotate dehydrogenase (NAD+) catalytic subunit